MIGGNVVTESKVDIANKAPSLIAGMDLPIEYHKDDIHVIVDYYSIDTLPDELKEWTFELVKKNLYTMYVNSNLGWNEADKKAEMREPAARYLIARSASDPNLLYGFLLLQMLLDDDIEAEVAYCYELQLEKGARNRGLGEFLMDLLQRIGNHWGMEKVMLTVFKANTGAFRFYTKKLGFEIDECSPSKYLSTAKARKYDYEILSKACQ